MKYIASCSFGKDSLATILLAKEHNEPLDFALFAEVMFDKERGISGEIPEHIEWIYSYAIPKLKELGVHTEVVRAEKDYKYFFQNAVGGQYKGKLYGFPIGGMCVINRECKMNPIRKFYKTITDDITQYVGIAADETKRLARLKGNQVSLLDKYGYTEKMAFAKCQEYGLISPIYGSSSRGGAGSVLTLNTPHSSNLGAITLTCGESWKRFRGHPTYAPTDSSTDRHFSS